MRNLKRVLSLTLASVMLLGMMVIGSSAATDYPDVDYDNDNVEAIEVLEAINVMTGYPEDGTFKPGNEVSRAEMARIMAALMDLEYDYYVGANPFTDMAGHWAEGYAAACAANGIIAGRTTTTYDPSATVTAVEAAAMLMRALGYFQNREVDYADGFEISTVRQAGRINLFDKVDVKTNEPMTRNDVAQLILNTLQSGMVEPDKNGTLSVTTPDGFTVATGATNYVYTIARNNTIGQAINDTTAADGNSTSGLRGFILDLGEQLYNGELKLKKDEQDVFGRPSRKWEFKGKEIGTYRKVELLEETYSVRVNGKDLYALLGKSTIDDYDLYVYIDGEDNATVLGTAYFDSTRLDRNDDNAVGGTGKGVTTEVYVDTEAKEITVVIINTYLAKADEDYNDKDDNLDLTVYNIRNSGSVASRVYVKDSTTDEPMTVSGEDFAIAEAEEDDLCLVQIAQGEIQEMWAPEILSAVIIDAFKKGGSGYVSTDGTQYDRASTGRYHVEVLDQYDQTHLKETTYNIILDQYGYMIGLEKNNDPDQFVFLTGIDAGASNLYATTADANIIHMDGTMETVKVDLTKSRNNLTGDRRLLDNWTRDAKLNYSQINVWCKYGVSSSGVYTLKMVPDATGLSTASVVPTTGTKVAQFAQDVGIYHDNALTNSNATPGIKEINEKHVSLVGWDTTYGSVAGSTENFVYGNEDTVYINVSLEAVSVKDTSNGGPERMIIDDVDNVAVGVKNVNLLMKDLDPTKTPNGSTTQFRNPDYEIYTLYNDKGIVLAAVTIGEDNGTANSYAYITSDDVRREEYGQSSTKATEGKWTWYRDAIVDGVKTSLTQTGDAGTMDLDELVQGEWYEIRYDVDGNVRRTEPIGFGRNSADGTYGYGDGSDTKYINSVDLVERAVNNFTTVLLHAKFSGAKAVLNFKNGVLYTAQNDTLGFHVSPDVKTVVSNAKSDGNNDFNSITDGYIGYTGLEKAIRDTNSRGTAMNNGDVQLSALLVNGFATVIVINDGGPVRTSAAGTGLTGSSTQMGVFIDSTQNVITANFLDGTSSVAEQQQIREAARAKGLNPLFININNGPGDPDNYLMETDGTLWYIALTEYYKVTIDGVPYDYVDTSGTKKANESWTPANPPYAGTGYIYSQTLDTATPTWNYQAYSGGNIATGLAGTTIPSHITIKTGYVTVPTNSTVNLAGSIEGSAGSLGVKSVTATVSNGAANYVPVGSNGGSMTVSVVIAPEAGATMGSTVSLALTAGGNATVTNNNQTVTKSEIIAGKTLTFTITGITANLTAIDVNTTDFGEPHKLTVHLVDQTPGGTTTEGGVAVTMGGASTSATPLVYDYDLVYSNVKKGEVIEVYLTLNGTSAAGGETLTVTPGTSSHAWDGASVRAAGADVTDADTVTLGIGGYNNQTITLLITVDDTVAAADEDIVITMDDAP